MSPDDVPPLDAVHCWTTEVVEPELSSWDPDREPARDATGRGGQSRAVAAEAAARAGRAMRAIA